MSRHEDPKGMIGLTVVCEVHYRCHSCEDNQDEHARLQWGDDGGPPPADDD